jgi:cobalt-zinc-cadmium efflux system protein
VYLFVEAIRRFLNPAEVDGTIMLIVAIIGLLANVISVIILHKDSAHNLNVKAAYLHLIGDTLSSVAVIGGGVLIYFYDMHWVDPLITVLIGAYILKEAVSIVKETVDILMQGTPKDLDLDKVQEAIEQMPGIKNIHHVHTWSMDEKQFHFEAHVDLEKDIMVSDSTHMQQEIEKMLNKRFGIYHVTLQFEHDACSDKELVNNHSK